MEDPKLLFKAVREKNADLLRSTVATLSASEPWPLDTDGHSPLHWAAMTDSTVVLEVLLSAVNNLRPVDVCSMAEAQLGQTPLHWACVAGNLSSVKLLLSHGADPAAVDGKGYNAATHTVHYGRVDILHQLFERSDALLPSADSEGHTLLQWAAYYDQFPIVTYLLRVRKADPNVADNNGMTALHRAAQRDRAVVAEMLLRGGADVHCRNAAGKSSLDVVEKGCRTYYILRSWGRGVLTKEKPVRPRHSLSNYGFVLFYYVLAISSYIKYRWALLEGILIGFRLSLMMHIFLVISVVSHMMAVFSDPGDIPKGNPESFVSYIEKTSEDGTSEFQLVPSAFCFSCLTPRPPRSKHSPERDCCVKVFDHECPWVNNTIGLNNHKTLLLLVLSTGILEWMFIYAMMQVLFNSPEVISWVSAIVERPSVCVFILIHSAVSCFCIMLFLTHLRLVLRGQTTYEHIVATREKQTSNPYDMGMYRNIVSFLTSTGPGTGKAISPVSVTTLQEVVLSDGSELDKTRYGYDVKKKDHGSIDEDTVEAKLIPR